MSKIYYEYLKVTKVKNRHKSIPAIFMSTSF